MVQGPPVVSAPWVKWIVGEFFRPAFLHFFFFCPHNNAEDALLLFLIHTHTSNMHKSVSFPATMETLQFTR